MRAGTQTRKSILLGLKLSENVKVVLELIEHLVRSLRLEFVCIRGLLFIMMLEFTTGLAQEFRVGCPWELLYAGDLVLLLRVYRSRLINSQGGRKALRLNMKKTKVIVSGVTIAT